MREQYRATVHREDGAWVGQVPDLEGVHSWHPKTLAGLRQGLAEAIVLAEDLPDEAIGEVVERIAMDVDFPNPEITALADLARAKRTAAAKAQRDAESATEAAVRELTSAGLSARDTGAVLGISHQRVAQLASKHRRVT